MWAIKLLLGKLIMKFEAVGAAPAAAHQQVAGAAAAAPTASAIIKEVNVPDIGGDEVNVTEIMAAVGDTKVSGRAILNHR